MQNAKRGSLAENTQPVGGCQLLRARSQLQRIRAIDAVQRTAVRDLGNQGQRIRRHGSNQLNQACHPERSEASAVRRKLQILRFAQDDNSKQFALKIQ